MGSLRVMAMGGEGNALLAFPGNGRQSQSICCRTMILLGAFFLKISKRSSSSQLKDTDL